MAIREEFHALLKAGKLSDALMLALSESVEMEVTTWVGSDDTPQALPGQRMRSRLDLVAGEVEHEIGEAFLDSAVYEQLKQFHLQQVEESRHTMIKNVESLQQLFSVLARILPQSAQNTPAILSQGQQQSDD